MKVLGGILIAVGILFAGASGLCSLMLILEEVNNANADMAGSLVIVGIVGGIPFLMGLGMIFGGWKLVSEKPRAAPVRAEAPVPPDQLRRAAPPETQSGQG